MSNQYAEWATNLPNQFSPLGEVMSQGLAMQQRRNEQLMKLQQEKLKQQKDDTDANLKYLNDKVGGINADTTGIYAINSRMHDELNNTFQKFKDIAKTVPPDQYQGELMQDLLEKSKWYQGAVTSYNSMVSDIGALTKEVPNIDPKYVRDVGMKNIAGNFINPDGSLVKSELIHNVDPLKDFQDKEMLAHATNDTTPFYDYFKKFEKTPVGDKEYISKKGFANKYNWKGSMLGDLTQLETGDDNKPEKIVLKYDTVPGMNDENGKPMRLMKDDVYKQLQGTKGIGNSMDKLWLDNKDKIIHDWTVRNWGRLKRLPNADEEENLKKNFLYKEAQNVIPSALQTDESNITPKPTQNNFYIGQEAVNNVYKSIQGKVNSFSQKGQVTRMNSLAENEQAAIRSAVGSDADISSMVLHTNPDGKIEVYDGTYDDKKHGFIMSPKTLVTTLSPIGTNFKVQPSVNEKRTVVAEGNDDTPTQPHKKKISGF